MKTSEQLNREEPEYHAVALIVGGPWDMAQHLARKLKKFGIRVEKKHHLGWDKKNQLTKKMSIPTQVDIVIALVDMLGHDDMKNLKGAVAKSEAKLVYSGRKWSFMKRNLKLTKVL